MWTISKRTSAANLLVAFLCAAFALSCSGESDSSSTTPTTDAAVSVDAVAADASTGVDSGSASTGDSAEQDTTSNVGSAAGEAAVAWIGEEVIGRGYSAVGQATAELKTSLNSVCADWEKSPDNMDTVLAGPRDAWKKTMAAWQRVVGIKAGPAKDPKLLIGEVVYSWPLVSSCAVDQDVVKLLETTDGSYDLSSRTANRRGLDALEYLLFAKNYDMTCSTVIAPKGWKPLTKSQRAAARCKFANAVVDDLSNQVKVLTDAWDSKQATSFLSADWLKAGKGGSIASTKAALNLLSDSMFYLHDVVMDVKLGAALGIKDNSCSVQGKPCLADLESKYAGYNKEMLLANLEGFQSLLTGQNPDGKQGASFDDVLTELDAKDLGDDMVKKTAAAISALKSIKGSIAEALEADYASVANAHKAIVAVVKVMKTEFMMTVGLEIPKEAAGDND